MELNDYQQKANSLAIYTDGLREQFPDVPEEIYALFGVAYAGLGFGGEVGEIQNKLKKIIRDSGGVISHETREDIKKELGDAMWYLAVVCKEFGLTMDEVAQANLDKLFDRKDRGVLTGSGDDR